MRKLLLIGFISFAACETPKQKEVHKITDIFPAASYYEEYPDIYVVVPNDGRNIDYLFRFDVDGKLKDTTSTK